MSLEKKISCKILFSQIKLTIYMLLATDVTVTLDMFACLKSYVWTKSGVNELHAIYAV